MNVILETDNDRALEDRVIAWLAGTFKAVPLRAPQLSFIDAFFAREGVLVAAMEIKTRKEPMEKVQAYGGLMLKERKLLELQALQRLMRLPTFIVFAFRNGLGEILLANVEHVHGLEAVVPPPRRNYRGLACDEDPVVYLDWDRHLSRVR